MIPDAGEVLLSLPGLEARVGFVDDVDAALPAHDPAILIPLFSGFERVHNFHGLRASEKPARGRPMSLHWLGKGGTIRMSAAAVNRRLVETGDALAPMLNLWVVVLVGGHAARLLVRRAAGLRVSSR